MCIRDRLKATLPGTTKLINVSVADRICYLNFDSSFRNTIDNKLTEYVVMYSIVNSRTSLPTVDKVQISLDGENDGMLLYNYKPVSYTHLLTAREYIFMIQTAMHILTLPQE